MSPPGESAEIHLDDFDVARTFAGHYQPVAAEVAARSPDYPLPLDLARVCNLDAVPEYALGPAHRQALEARGFVVSESGRSDDLLAVFEWATGAGLPIIVTADALLHLYHVLFDLTLRDIEEREFHHAMAEFSRCMMVHCLAQHRALPGELQEAARRNVAFFAVALRCLVPDAATPDIVEDLVQAELAAIDAHGGYSSSAVFDYEEDFSQYVPRGHYTHSEMLEQYFRALMYFGRMTMFLTSGPNSAVNPEVARRHTQQAALIASVLHGRVGEDLLATWRRVYAVTAFYVGFADDLTPTDYAEALVALAGTSFAWETLAREDIVRVLSEELRSRPGPRIYGGAGDLAAGTGEAALPAPVGMRLMGQRFVPDGHMLQELAFPGVERFLGEGQPFSLFPGGGLRGFSMGLDVMAVLGSERAAQLQRASGDAAYEGYEEQLAALRAEYGSLSPAEWNQNLYWSWLHCLQALIDPPGEGWPTFMRTDAWLDRSLQTALASWAQLRHDTILYAKQSYVPRGLDMPPEPRPTPPGWVEPRPEFLARLLALSRMTLSGLQAMAVLDEQSARRLQAFDTILERLLAIVRVELSGAALSEDDARFIEGIAGHLKHALVGIDSEDLRTTMVADVLTNADAGQALEEAVGNVMLLLACYPLPDGAIAVGAGPVLSHFEFKHPMADRLTDEAWRQLLMTAPPPAAPWLASFVVTDG